MSLFGLTLEALYVTASLLVLTVILTALASFIAGQSVPLMHLTPASTHVIVTGGSSGIGLSVAKKLSAKGINVTILARDEKKLRSAVEEMKSVAPQRAGVSKQQLLQWFSCDVSDFAAVSRVVDAAVQANGGRVDALIASAGVSQPERFLETDLKHFSRLMETNYFGVVYATRAVVPHLKNNGGGRIIYISSVLGLMGFPGYAAYCASKFAIHGLAQSLHIELSRFNIAFSLSVPGNVDTPMFVEENKIKPPEVKKIEGTKGVATPDHIAIGIIDSFSHWRYHIPSDGYFGDTWNVAALSGGMTCASPGELFWQMLISGLMRPWALLEVASYRSILKSFKYEK
jgi:3-dehydrosphinganine reductase/AP-1 complex subunit gamma-1